MQTTEIALTTEAQERLDDHLDRIDQVLRRQNMARRERLSVCDDVESQILDMLSRREKEHVSAVDVSEVLRKLDPPESFGGEPLRANADKLAPRKPAPALLPELSALLAFLTGTALLAFFIADPSEQFLVLGTVILVVTASICARMSYLAFQSASGRRFSGLKRWLAIFGLIFLPLLTLFALPVINRLGRTGASLAFWSQFEVAMSLSLITALLGAAFLSLLVSRVVNVSSRPSGR
jgi:hypothetical protein